MKKFFLSSIVIAFLFAALPSQAKIWRINNNPGVTADFISLGTAVASASVLAGDTLYFEASTTNYAGGTISKRLVIVGLGFFLDPSNVTTPGNAGLQASTVNSELSSFTIANGANGSKFLGIGIAGVNIQTSASAYNLVFEKVHFTSTISFANATMSNFTFRKCFFQASIQATSGDISNVVIENCIFVTGGAYVNGQAFTGSGNIIRNNTFSGTYLSTLSNVYFANNIVNDPSYDWSFTNCVIKNNLFARNQTLPGTAVNNSLSVNMTNTLLLTGSYDGRYQLKPGSPAIGAGLTVGSVVSPDCGAFGATDPYKLSGIPNIPSIYALTVPISIPSGSATMNVTFSTRNTN